IIIGEDGRPVLCGERTIDREIYKEPYDLVVLATGMEASTTGSFKPESGAVVDDYGFVVPELGDGQGIFSAGVAGGPFDVSMSAQSATAAALKAIQAVRAAGS
ncbi:MAG: heterodisulfide reductase subunit A, partial [Hyphomicrobiales bacterium]|nr:heterodisulfide reductase subunit A [Hyphomicrobiales bacterium]